MFSLAAGGTVFVTFVIGGREATACMLDSLHFDSYQRSVLDLDCPPRNFKSSHVFRLKRWLAEQHDLNQQMVHQVDVLPNKCCIKP